MEAAVRGTTVLSTPQQVSSERAQSQQVSVLLSERMFIDNDSYSLATNFTPFKVKALHLNYRYIIYHVFCQEKSKPEHNWLRGSMNLLVAN